MEAEKMGYDLVCIHKTEGEIAKGEKLCWGCFIEALKLGHWVDGIYYQYLQLDPNALDQEMFDENNHGRG